MRSVKLGNAHREAVSAFPILRRTCETPSNRGAAEEGEELGAGNEGAGEEVADVHARLLLPLEGPHHIPRLPNPPLHLTRKRNILSGTWER